MSDVRRGATLAARLAGCAAGGGGAVDYRVVGGAELTFGEWARRANAAARGLAGRGVGRGDRVVLVCSGSGWLDFAVGYVAVTTLGAAVVPVAVEMRAEQLRRVAREGEG